MNEFCRRGKQQTQEDRRRVAMRRPQNLLRTLKLVETTADDVMSVLKAGGAMTNAFVRCLHNLALGLGWLPWPILPSKLWPVVEAKKETRHHMGRTPANHCRREKCRAATILRISLGNRAQRKPSPRRFARSKLTGSGASFPISGKKPGRVGAPANWTGRLEDLLRKLPSNGFLFVKVAKTNNSARSAEFRRRCRSAEIERHFASIVTAMLGRSGHGPAVTALQNAQDEFV